MTRTRNPLALGGLSGAVWSLATTASLPLIEYLLASRRARGREDHDRMGERRGVTNVGRPKGPLAWIHAASIGEALSVLRLIEGLLSRYPTLNVLVTTGTVTSARLLADRLPPRALHQFVPVDRPAWVDRFLDHWRPDLAMWVESELWPNLVFATQVRDIPMVLLNARMSARSFSRWQRLPGLGRRLMQGFSLVMAQDPVEADRLRALGAPAVTTPGNLKFAAGPLPFEERALATVRETTRDRAIWVASSTHEGEEEIAAYAHRRLENDVPGLLTMIAPRHPERGADIAAKLRARGFRVARREADEPVTAETEIYLADTLGELGLLYRVARVAFIGGSLIPHGGQNVLEPARLGCAVLHGPHMENFRAIVDEMSGRGAAHEVADAEELVKALRRLLTDEALRTEVAGTGQVLAAAKDSILESVLGQLETVMAGLAVRAHEDAPGDTAPSRK